MAERKPLEGLDYELHVAGLTRYLPVCPLNDTLSIAGFVIFGDAELTVACASELIKKLPEHDIMITAEAKGIPLIHEMARQTGEAEYIVARKGAKLYMQDVVCVEVQSITTAKKQKLYIDKVEGDKMKGKRVLVVDDVISTGESLRAIEQLVEHAGGQVVGRVAILAEGEAADREDIIFLEKLPLFHSDGTPME